jgi:hypothetical protein
MNTYFLRFTDDIQADIKRGCSYHSTGIRKEDMKKAQVAEMMDCDKEDIVVLDGYYVQELPGLCAFLIEAEDLEEAIEEVESNDWGIFDPVTEGWVLMTGVDVDNCPEGVVIRPGKVLHEVKY